MSDTVYVDSGDSTNSTDNPSEVVCNGVYSKERAAHCVGEYPYSAG